VWAALRAALLPAGLPISAQVWLRTAPSGVARGAAVEGDQAAERDGLIGSGVGQRRGVGGGQGNAGRGAVDAAVVDDQLGDVGAGEIGGEAGPDAARVAEHGLAGGGTREQRPAEGQRVAIDVAGAAAVEGDDGAERDRLVGTGMGDRRRVFGADADRVGQARKPAVADGQRDQVAAGQIDEQTRIDAVGVAEGGAAARRDAAQLPGVLQRVAVDVGRVATVEHDQSAHAHALVGAGVGDRPAVLGADGDRVGNAAGPAVADDELDEVLPRFVGSEARGDGGGFDQLGEAAEGALAEDPGVTQRVAVGVGRGGAAEHDELTDPHALVGAGVGERRLVYGAALGARAAQGAEAAVDRVDQAIGVGVARVARCADLGAGENGFLDEGEVVKVDVAVGIDVARHAPDPAGEYEPEQDQPHPMFRDSKHRPSPLVSVRGARNWPRLQSQAPRLVFGFLLGSLCCLLRPFWIGRLVLLLRCGSRAAWVSGRRVLG
jgi:hypothetical protein